MKHIVVKEALHCWETNKVCYARRRLIGTISDALIADALKAAALPNESARDRYLAVFDNPEQIRTNEVLTGKRLTRERLLVIIRQALPATPDLCTSDHFSVEQLPRGDDLRADAVSSIVNNSRNETPECIDPVD